MNLITDKLNLSQYPGRIRLQTNLITDKYIQRCYEYEDENNELKKQIEDLEVNLEHSLSLNED
ncbi:34029_t:CDS:2, partial [Gigaspora margarita]